ncbi:MULTISPECIES: hypothetical protein [unclassified Streptomyces]|uniref:hypothetical protein n=1 Tax=unclassified Streptomyces TaxID=2593676 RepID=UPI003256700B
MNLPLGKYAIVHTSPLADPIVVVMRAVVDDLVASTYAIGELMLEVAPALPVRRAGC